MSISGWRLPAIAAVLSLAFVPAMACSENGGEDGMGGAASDGAFGFGGGAAHPDVEPAVFFFDTVTVEDAGGSNQETLFSFDSGPEDWRFGTASAADATWVSDGGEQGGGLKLEIPFTGYNQESIVEHEFKDELPNWDGKVLRVRVLWESGFSVDPGNPGNVQLVVKTGEEFVFGQGPETEVETEGEWVEYSFDLSDPNFSDDGWDPSQVKAVGLEFDTGDP